jgi:hypothetical protein
MWRWPDAHLDPSVPGAVLSGLARHPKPSGPLDLAAVCSEASTAMNLAPSRIVPEVAAGVANLFLEWYPDGQMIALGNSYQHLTAGRLPHMLAAATLFGWDAIEETLAAGKGGLWFHGENILTAHPGSIYLNLINEIDLPGVALETLPITFIFEFGEHLTMQRLDFMGRRYVNSLPVAEYLSDNRPDLEGWWAPANMVRTDSLDQGALREWFIAGFNRLADHLIRWQNFMTTSGELRPVVQQQTNMTVGRILYTSAHLLASGERGARLADFWQLVDLYAGLQGGGIPRLFSEKYWEETVVAAVGTLPGDLALSFQDYARTLYKEWVDQTLAGVIPPSRVTSSGVAVPYPNGERVLPPQSFLAVHLQERRDTLHGYDLSKPVQAALLGIHNGSLPRRLPEWGRLMLLTLLAEPNRFIERRFLHL